MSILYISASRVPSRAANSIHVMKMCNAFAKNGQVVHLMTARVHSDTERNIGDIFAFYGVDKGFSLYRLPWLEIPNFAFIYALQITTIFLFLTAKNLARPHCYSRFTLGLFLVSFFGPKLTYEMHAALPQLWSEQFMFRQLIKRKHFDKVVVISKGLRDTVLQDFPELKEKIVIAHDGADEVDKTIKINLSDNPASTVTNLGYIGHLYKGRGIKLLVDLVKDDPSLHLHLIGGVEDDIKYWKTVTANYKNVTIYGFIPPQETSKYRNSMDILLAPYEERVAIYGSSMDTSKWMSPLKIFEYMSAEKPIICSDLPVLREVLTHEKNCLLCTPNDLASWKMAVVRLIQEKDLAQRLGTCAYEDFVQNYTWSKRAKKVLG